MQIATAPRLTEEPRAKPFLKWAGGKGQLLNRILERFPAAFKRYHEPFIGGGAVFFGLQPKRASLSDINPDLIETYRVIRDQPELLVDSLSQHQATEQHYYQVRSQGALGLSSTESAARTIFLNRTCFNGLYRVNRSGQFNVPFGRYANPKVCNSDNLYRVSLALQGVDLQVCSAMNIGGRVRRGDLVYFDPPYDPISPTASFTAYARQGFGRDEQAQLAELLRKLAGRGVHVVLSNSDTPLIRQLYRGFRVERVMARRAINSRADRRGKVGEVLVSAT